MVLFYHKLNLSKTLDFYAYLCYNDSITPVKGAICSCLSGKNPQILIPKRNAIHWAKLLISSVLMTVVAI